MSSKSNPLLPCGNGGFAVRSSRRAEPPPEWAAGMLRAFRRNGLRPRPLQVRENTPINGAKFLLHLLATTPSGHFTKTLPPPQHGRLIHAGKTTFMTIISITIKKVAKMSLPIPPGSPLPIFFESGSTTRLTHNVGYPP